MVFTASSGQHVAETSDDRNSVCHEPTYRSVTSFHDRCECLDPATDTAASSPARSRARQEAVSVQHIIQDGLCQGRDRRCAQPVRWAYLRASPRRSRRGSSDSSPGESADWTHRDGSGGREPLLGQGRRSWREQVEGCCERESQGADGVTAAMRSARPPQPREAIAWPRSHAGRLA